MKQLLGTENLVLQQVEHIFKTVYAIWSEIASKVNLENNIKDDLVNNPNVQANEYNISILQLYEVGLLCDMEEWFRLSKNDCIVFCGHLHAEVLKIVLLRLHFKVLF
jgi:hypothetical protein